jgi:hypothetical protein
VYSTLEPGVEERAKEFFNRLGSSAKLNFRFTAFSEVAPDFISQHTIPVVIRAGL